MTTRPPQRSRFSFDWLAGWSWAERIIVAATWLAPIVVVIGGGRDWGWLAGVLALAAFALLNLVVWRHGGWRLLGPHFYYDVVRLARRGRSTVLRVIYIFALFVGLALAFESAPVTRAWRPNDFAFVSERFTFALFMVQNIAVMILTPAYLASAIAEERERKTLEMLFTTQISDTEIVLGILFARVIHLIGFVLAGLPILTLIQFWGGIDILLLAGNVANTILNIITIGSICLFISTWTKTVTGAVMTSYAVVLPTAFCCVASMRGALFVLQDARSAGSGFLTVQDLGPLFLGHAVITGTCLTLAIASLRVREPFAPAPTQQPPRRGRERSASRGRPTVVLPATGVTDRPGTVATVPFEPPSRPKLPIGAQEPERLDALAVPYTLPPISDNALIWKERFLGGPALAFSPVVLVPMVPFLATGVLLMGAWFLRALFLERADFERALGMWFGVLRFFYYVFLACYAIGVAFRATSSVARERQQQTLEPLLLLPIDRRDILWAKLVGCLWRGWPWFALVLVDVALGTLIGAYHPFSAVLLCIAPWPFLLCLANLSLFFSVNSATVLRANMMLVLVLIVLVVFSFFCPWGVGPLSYPETVAFSSWNARGQIIERGLIFWSGRHRLWGAGAIVYVYSVGALMCWALAQYQFERRSRQS